jgi:hypothetical protein
LNRQDAKDAKNDDREKREEDERTSEPESKERHVAHAHAESQVMLQAGTKRPSHPDLMVGWHLLLKGNRETTDEHG